MPALFLIFASNNKARHLCRALFLYLLFFLCGCTEIRDFYDAPQQNQTREVHIYADGLEYITRISASLTVDDALRHAGVSLNSSDRVSPLSGSPIPADGIIRVIRVTFEDEVSRKVIPFQSQTIQNELLPDGTTSILQQGRNGEQEITTRTVYEDGIPSGKSVISSIITQESLPEILMIGAKSSYSPIQISGRLIYISDGNAWMMEGSTENRTPLISSGDLDGRILDLSADGRWLLYSRKGTGTEVNSLWMLDLSDWTKDPVDLRVENVLRFAAWLPGDARRFLYSTVEPADHTPGWTASNDLRMQYVSDTGMLMEQQEIVAPDDSGDFSWWGTEFALSADARRLLYATAEEIGVIERMSGKKETLIQFSPYEKTRSDWAWIPGISWNADHNGFYFTFHGKTDGTLRTFDEMDYHIGFYNLQNDEFQVILQNSGLFSYPSASPRFSDGSAWLAWLQTEQPRQTESERYKLMVADESGSQPQTVYPSEGSSSYLTPQHLTWSPDSTRQNCWLAFLKDGNIWLLNPFTGISNPITSDGSVTGFIWE